jgi:hypothetical protein
VRDARLRLRRVPAGAVASLPGTSVNDSASSKELTRGRVHLRGATGSFTDDRARSHMQVIMLNKLRCREGFAYSWRSSSLTVTCAGPSKPHPRSPAVQVLQQQPADRQSCMGGDPHGDSERRCRPASARRARIPGLTSPHDAQRRERRGRMSAPHLAALAGVGKGEGVVRATGVG